MRRPPGHSFPSLVLCTAVLVAACQRGTDASVTDDAGRKVPIPRRVGRLVTLAPNLSEIVAAIGVGEKIVGTDDSSDYPPEIEEKPKVGGVQPSPERIASLSPDLVVVSSSVSHPGLAPVLQRLSIPLYVSRTSRLDDVPRTMRVLGSILEAPKAEAAARAFEHAIGQQRRVRRRKPRILFMVWPDPLYVAGRETYIDDLIELTGGTNAVPPGVRDWPQYSLEALMSDAPDLILFPATGRSDEVVRGLLQNDSRWSALKGNLHTSLIAVDEDLFSRPGPRLPQSAASLNGIIDEWERRQ